MQSNKQKVYGIRLPNTNICGVYVHMYMHGPPVAPNYYAHCVLNTTTDDACDARAMCEIRNDTYDMRKRSVNCVWHSERKEPERQTERAPFVWNRTELTEAFGLSSAKNGAGSQRVTRAFACIEYMHARKGTLLYRTQRERESLRCATPCQSERKRTVVVVVVVVVARPATMQKCADVHLVV